MRSVGNRNARQNTVSKRVPWPDAPKSLAGPTASCKPNELEDVSVEIRVHKSIMRGGGLCLGLVMVSSKSAVIGGNECRATIHSPSRTTRSDDHPARAGRPAAGSAGGSARAGAKLGAGWRDRACNGARSDRHIASRRRRRAALAASLAAAQHSVAARFRRAEGAGGAGGASLRASGRDVGIGLDQLRPAHYALCASLDDVVLATPWGSQGAWAAHPSPRRFTRKYPAESVSSSC